MRDRVFAELTNRQAVLAVEETARLDFYESMRGADKPCWFIRRAFQGAPLSGICDSPRNAWRDAAEAVLSSISKKAGKR
jgi:hypothetical protein